jgi:PAP2 superfamily
MGELSGFATSRAPSIAARTRAWCSRDRLVGIVGVAAFLGGSAYMLARNGLFIQTDTIVIWVLAGLLAVSLTDLRRLVPLLLVDWLPFGALLVVYDYSRQLSQWLGTSTHSALQIRFDTLLFGDPLLTVRLQHWLHQTKAVRPWEYALFGVYMTHFFAALVVAAFLWRFAYPRFRQFRAQIVALTTLVFASYVVYPTDPPWLVSQHLHQLPTIYRVVFEVWGKLGLRTAASVFEHGNELGNQVAAVPSMHAATSLFICLFFWKGARPWLRALLVGYVLAMAFTLVYSGEHYVFDIVVGWLYAAVVYAAAPVFSRWRERRAGYVSRRPAVGIIPALAAYTPTCPPGAEDARPGSGSGTDAEANSRSPLRSGGTLSSAAKLRARGRAATRRR